METGVLGGGRVSALNPVEVEQEEEKENVILQHHQMVDDNVLYHQEVLA